MTADPLEAVKHLVAEVESLRESNRQLRSTIDGIEARVKAAIRANGPLVWSGDDLTQTGGYIAWGATSATLEP